MKITSRIRIGQSLLPAPQDEVKKEPMLHRSDWKFAYENGGELTRRFLDSIPEEWHQSPILIDSRVHMLMPGMFPCIPGWHHDDVPRSRSDGQPNYDSPEYRSEHVMALYGDCSLTEFAIGDCEIEIPPVGRKVYKELSPVIEKMCIEGKLERVVAPECAMIYFDWQTWHKGAPTTKHGFRFFIRATRNSGLPAKNEMRYNANVYMPVLDEGW